MDEIIEIDYAGLGEKLSSLDDNTADTPYKLRITNYNETEAFSLNDLILKNKKYVDLSNTELDGIKSFDMAFDSCKYLVKSPVLTNLKTTRLDGAFFGCESLTEVSLLNCENVESIRGIFSGCKSLKSVDISALKNIKTYEGAFQNSGITADSIDTSFFKEPEKLF